MNEVIFFFYCLMQLTNRRKKKFRIKITRKKLFHCKTYTTTKKKESNRQPTEQKKTFLKIQIFYLAKQMLFLSFFYVFRFDSANQRIQKSKKKKLFNNLSNGNLLCFADETD